MELGATGMTVQQVTMQYLRPFVDGPFRCEVTVERQGRTMANTTVRMWSGGKLAGLVLASMAHRRPVGEKLHVGAGPRRGALRPRRGAAPLRVRPARPRTGVVPAPDHGGRRSRPGPGRWVVLPRTPELIDHRWGVLLADLWTPAIYHMWPTGHIAQSADLTYHARVELPPDAYEPGTPLLVVLTTRSSQGGFVDEDAEIWSPDGRLLGLGRQSRYVHA